MSTWFSDAAEAAKASSAMNCVARCHDTTDNRDWLMTHCDDSADGDELEYWGTDDSGQAWRVHLPAAR